MSRKVGTMAGTEGAVPAGAKPGSPIFSGHPKKGHYRKQQIEGKAVLSLIRRDFSCMTGIPDPADGDLRACAPATAAFREGAAATRGPICLLTGVRRVLTGIIIHIPILLIPASIGPRIGTFFAQSGLRNADYCGRFSMAGGTGSSFCCLRRSYFELGGSAEGTR
jgi:hypothetical protein